jgi:hypothetical protein
VPAWADGATLAVGGHPEPAAPGTYAGARRAWAAGDTLELVLPMDVRLTDADERVDDVRGCVAIERGPLVYAVEQVDQADGVAVDDLCLEVTGAMEAEHRPDVLGGVTVVRAGGRVRPRRSAGDWPYARVEGAQSAAAEGRSVPVTAVPYYAWANRGIGPMRVWLPRA